MASNRDDESIVPVRPPELICLECDWGSCGISRAEAEERIRQSNGRLTLNDFRCARCRGTRFRLAREGELPPLVNLIAVIWEPDNE